MKDLSDRKWIYLKGFLFLLIGSVSAALVLFEMPTLRVAALLALMTWGFCRAYYFAFYVIEKYVDARFRFSGLGSFVKYWFTRRR
jgi:hypothetical protein